MSGAAAETATPAIDPVSVTLADLVRLAPLARQLELWQERREIEDGGNHHSVFKGRGMEFAETRPYQPGDDIRHIDWRVTARSGRAHTKLFREERERPVLLWVDCRAHMFFATRGMFKSVLAARLAALIAWIAHAHGDCSGGRVLAPSGEIVLAPERGRASVLRLLRALERACAWPKDLSDGVDAHLSLQSLVQSVRPGTAVFLISDFHDLAGFVPGLLARIAQHSNVTLCHLHDPLESELPPPGQYPIAAPDGALAIIDTRDPALVRAHQTRFQQRLQQLHGDARRHRARFLSIATTADPLQALRDVSPRRTSRAER